MSGKCHFPTSRAQAPLGKTPIPVKAKVEIAIVAPPVADVDVTQTFQEKSDVPRDHIAIEPFPPPKCLLVEQK